MIARFPFLALLGSLTLLSSPALAQVVIDMPSPPRTAGPPRPSQSKTPPPALAAATGTSSAIPVMLAAPVTTEVGDVALRRYALGRSGVYDTYFNDGQYVGGVRVYTYPRYYPQFVWGPWFGRHFPGLCW